MLLRDSTACCCLLLCLIAPVGLSGQEARLLEKEGQVMVTKSGQSPAAARLEMELGVRDRLGTGYSSRAVLQMSSRWLARIDEETDIEITPGVVGTNEKDAVSVALGGVFVYSREDQGELKIITPSATGGLRGTQLVVRVRPGGRTQMQVIEGEVALANAYGQVLLQPGEMGEAEPGSAPRKTAAISAQNLLQWTLYYPAVLPKEDLHLTLEEQAELHASLSAYGEGDLLGALEHYPPNYIAATPGSITFHAAILLAAGKIEAARTALKTVPAESSGRKALERIMAAVLFIQQPAVRAAATAGEAMAESYFQQSWGKLEAALLAARRATELAPDSGYTWTRLAELEFSFGRVKEAQSALARGLTLTPRNAQAHALNGFLMSADNRLNEAKQTFEHAIQLDGALGNAWLGLGLVKIKQGDASGGRADLQTAATVEPNRAFFYSYHGKALSLTGSDQLAEKDLALAKKTDPGDPTPWLYNAILKQQNNRYNQAIAEMVESLRLNDNRQVYRSRFLLDQDRAVRSSNLARIYQNNGMTDLSVREATRAVEGDYTNPSAHLFLANSFDALRDPQRLLLRYETAWFNELLLANLLAPVGGGPLSQYVSQQEYSQLLESDGAGGFLVADVRDKGYQDVQASLFLTKGRLSSGLDYLFHSDPGTRANNDNRHEELYWQTKFQVSPVDVFYTLVKWDNLRGGERLLNIDNLSTQSGFRFEDKQDPGLLLAGWNHRWAPGVHTLFLGGRLAARQVDSQPGTKSLRLILDSNSWQPGFLRPDTSGKIEYVSPELRNAPVKPVTRNADGSLKLSPDFLRTIAPFLRQGSALSASQGDAFDSETQRNFDIYTAELQQIWQSSRHTLVTGGRWQKGDIAAEALLSTSVNSFLYASPASQQYITADFERRGLYVYDFARITQDLTIIAGVAWNRLVRPENYRQPPYSEVLVTDEQIGAKLGFTFIPSQRFSFRGIYSESQGGVDFDESVRLEPVQLAGFNQAFRTIISEALAGSVEAPVYKNLGLSIEGTVAHRTWWAASFNQLRENVTRTFGVFDLISASSSVFPFPGIMVLPSGTSELYAYRENLLTAGLNHLVGEEWALGMKYVHTTAVLNRKFPQIRSAPLNPKDEATLHELNFQANWNSPQGWFARADATWYEQHVAATTSVGAAVDQFWQMDVQVGRRFQHSRREISAGLLNLTDTDYRLSPLTYTRNLPRERTFFVRCRVGF